VKGDHRALLFDLAVARADTYLRRARLPASGGREALHSALEVWNLKTRFSSRIALDDLVDALAQRPEGEGWRWRGGREGSWQRAS
jgi:uncharacterized protein YfiM (DUF2279 family)